MSTLHVGTIRKVHEQLVSNGYLISENAIRVWIKEGTLPATYCGTVAYISYDRIVDLLNAPAVSPS